MQQVKLGYTPPGGSITSVTLDVYSCKGLFRPDDLKPFPPIKNEYIDATTDTQVQTGQVMITVDFEMGQFNSVVPMNGNFASDKQIQLWYWALDNSKTIDTGLGVPAPSAAAIGGSTALANGTYYYVVSAVDSLGETSAPDANEVTVTIGDNSTQIPAISWTAIPNAISYRIYRSTSSHTYGATSFLKEVSVVSTTDTGSPALSAGTRRATTQTSVVLEDVSKFLNTWENGRQYSKHYMVRLQRVNPVTTWP